MPKFCRRSDSLGKGKRLFSEGAGRSLVAHGCVERKQSRLCATNDIYQCQRKAWCLFNPFSKSYKSDAVILQQWVDGGLKKRQM